MHIEDTRSIPPSEKYISSADAQRIVNYYHVSQQDAEEHLSILELQKKMTLDLLRKKKAALN